MNLELTVRLRKGREVECARWLRGELDAEAWEILAGLAAEVVALHEAAAAGGRSVVVVGVSDREADDILRGRRHPGGTL